MPQMVKAWFEKYGVEKFVLALDINIVEGRKLIAIHGWQENQ